MRNIPVILLFSFTAVSPLSDLFYPYGDGKGDTLSPGADDVSSDAIMLQSPFSFFGHTYSQLYVNNNGDLTFNQKLSAYVPTPFVADGNNTIIAPLWTDLDNSVEGVISYNQYSEGSVLSRATKDINQYFPEVNFAASWVFVATWDGVPYYNQPGKASFQVVLISRGTLSFVLMNYGPIDPTTHQVEAGYDTFKHSFQILKSASSISDLCKTSNVNVPGRWAFWVNQGSSYTTTSGVGNSALYAVIGVIAGCGCLSVIIAIFSVRRKRRGNSADDANQKQNVDPNAKDDTYTALDPMSRSSDDVYNTLTTVHSSPSDDLYSALDPQSRSPEYDTLATVRNQH